MKQNSASLSLHETELQVARARLAFNTDLHRVGTAFQDALTRPSTLLIAAGVTGVIGCWLARRTLTPVPSSKRHTEDHRPTRTASSVFGLILGFMTRYGAQRLLAGLANARMTKFRGT